MTGGNAPDTHTHKMIDSLVKDGYVVVAPDYEGLGESVLKDQEIDMEIHPFLNLKSEAYSITDAVVAVKTWLGNKASNKWAVAGHSLQCFFENMENILVC